MRRAPTVLGYWLPPALWMGLIFWLSTDQFSAGSTGSILESLLGVIGLSLSPDSLLWIHFIIRKLAHLSGYAVLALLLYRAFRSGDPVSWNFKWALRAFLIAALYAVLDEYHQSLTEHRTGSLADSLIDMVGSLGALVGKRLSSSNRRARDGAI